MNKKGIKILTWSIAAIIIAFSLYAYLGFKGYITEYRLKKESKPMIQKIDEYKETHGFYPKKISDVGFPEPDESGPIYYDLRDSNTSYTISFGMGLGESFIYDSKTKKWRFIH